VKSFSQLEPQIRLMLVARKAVFLLAAFLVTANAWCVATCIATEGSRAVPQSHDSGKLPPCHQHHGPKQSTATKPCIDSVVVVEGRSSSPSLERHSLELPVAVSGVGSDQPLPALTAHTLPAASPPILVEDRSTLVLRI
jgi:hypothetical protein